MIPERRSMRIGLKMKRRICFLLIIAVIAVAGVSLLSAGPHDEEQAFRENVQEILDRYIQGAYPKDYADMDATLILPMPDENAGICNVIGRVLCTEKNELIANAVITVKNTAAGTEAASVTTDGAGCFQILGLPGGFYDWIVERDGYCTAAYIGYDICDGITTTFSFDVSEQETIEREGSHCDMAEYDTLQGSYTG